MQTNCHCKSCSVRWMIFSDDIFIYVIRRKSGNYDMGIVTKKEPKGYCLLIHLYTKKVIKGSEKNSNCMLQHMMLVNEDYNCSPLKATVAQAGKIISVFLLVLVQRLSWESFSLSLAAQQGWQPNMATSAIPVHLFSTLSRRDMATSRKDTCILKRQMLVSFVETLVGHHHPLSTPLCLGQLWLCYFPGR